MPPTRSNSCSWSTRRSFACSAGEQVADLVQEERPSRRELEPTRLLALGARECATLVSEQLGLEERLGKGRAVHGDERPVGASRSRGGRPRDQLLAGPALARDQDRRVGRRDLGRQGQRRPERGGLADEAVESVALVEGLTKGFHAALELTGPELETGQSPLLLAEPLVLDREDQLGRDAAGDLHVGGVEPGRLALREVERAAHLVAEPQRDHEDRTTAVVDDEPVPGQARVQLQAGVVHQDWFTGSDAWRRRRRAQGHALRRLDDGRLVELGQDLGFAAALVQESRAHEVEVERRAHRLREPVEDVPDVQTSGQGAGQAIQRHEALAAAPFALVEDLALDEGADEVGDSTQEDELRVRVSSRFEAGGDEGADDSIGPAKGHREERPDPGLEHPAFDGIGRDVAGVGPDVVHAHALPGERGADPPLGDHVSPSRVEVGRVVTLVHGELRRGVLREDGERATIVLAVVDHEPVMRDQVLDALRERPQEAPGVEAILHRPADGLDRREEIGQVASRPPCT